MFHMILGKFARVLCQYQCFYYFKIKHGQSTFWGLSSNNEVPFYNDVGHSKLRPVYMIWWIFMFSMGWPSGVKTNKITFFHRVLVCQINVSTVYKLICSAILPRPFSGRRCSFHRDLKNRLTTERMKSITDYLTLNGWNDFFCRLNRRLRFRVKFYKILYCGFVRFQWKLFNSEKWI